MNSVNTMIKQFGRDVCLRMDDGWTSGKYTAFLQPLKSKNRTYFEGIQTNIGFSGSDYYLYIGPTNHNLCALPKDAWLEDIDKTKYYICKAEKMFLGNNFIYVWAVLKKFEEIDYEEYF